MFFNFTFSLVESEDKNVKNLKITAIKNVLRQGNLNPEIEEKLLTLQRYQEKQAKGEPFDPKSVPTKYSTRELTTGSGYDSPLESDDFDDEASNQSVKKSSRKRGSGGGDDDDDDEWVLDTPRKYIKKADREKSERKKIVNYIHDVKKQSSEEKQTKVIVKTTDTGAIRKNIIFYNNPEVQIKGQKNFNVLKSCGELEKSSEKAILASKLKLKAAQKLGMTEEQIKHHKLQVFKQQFFFFSIN